jgi:hypothetical protein
MQPGFEWKKNVFRTREGVNRVDLFVKKETTMLSNPLTDPTFSTVLATIKNESKDFAWVTYPKGMIKCICKLSKKKATIDFDLVTDANNWNLSLQAQETLSREHKQYLDKTFSSSDFKNGIDCHFGKASIRFDILREDAEIMFQWIYSALSNNANLVKLSIKE